ncbi:hypothetical protein B0J14DRAFT_696904 [Halenospora varia]|nr:hypothetical protein B0J14DRAFT_696904 [Halenospora varia]
MSNLSRGATYMVERRQMANELTNTANLCENHMQNLENHLALPFMSRLATKAVKDSLHGANRQLTRKLKALRHTLVPFPSFINRDNHIAPSNCTINVASNGEKTIVDEEGKPIDLFFGPIPSLKEQQERGITIIRDEQDPEAILKAPVKSYISVDVQGYISIKITKTSKEVWYWGAFPTIQEIIESDLVLYFKGAKASEGVTLSKKDFMSVTKKSPHSTKNPPSNPPCCKTPMTVEFKSKKGQELDFDPTHPHVYLPTPEEVMKEKPGRYLGGDYIMSIAKKRKAAEAAEGDEKTARKKRRPRPLLKYTGFMIYAALESQATKVEVRSDFSMMEKSKTELATSKIVNKRATALRAKLMEHARFHEQISQPNLVFIGKRARLEFQIKEEGDLNGPSDFETRFPGWKQTWKQKQATATSHTEEMVKRTRDIKWRQTYRQFHQLDALEQKEHYKSREFGSETFRSAIAQELAKPDPNFDKINSIQDTWQKAYVMPEIHLEKVDPEHATSEFLQAVLNTSDNPTLPLDTIERIKAKFEPAYNSVNLKSYPRDLEMDKFNRQGFSGAQKAAINAKKFVELTTDMLQAAKEAERHNKVLQKEYRKYGGIPSSEMSKQFVLSAVPLRMFRKKNKGGMKYVN